MFAYLCKGCDVTGWTKDWPPVARCWCCGKSDKLVPDSFSREELRLSGEDAIVRYYET